MPQFRRDIRHAMRALAHRRAYTVTCTLTLALVLGANAAIFAVVSATFLRPLPFTNGERVVQLYMLPPGLSGSHQRNPLQQMDLLRMRDRATTLRRIEGFLRAERVVIASGEPTVVKTAYVTSGLLSMMGAAPLEGRLFRADEEQPGRPVAVVSEGYRRRALGSLALGDTVVLDGTPHEVVGVTRADFRPSFLDAEVFVPLVANPQPLGRSPSRSVIAVAELADGVSVQDANAEVKRMVEGTAAEFPRLLAGWTGGAQSAREWLFGTVRVPVLTLFGAAVVVLLIACANIANLTSAQLVARAADLALRAALGATRLDLLRLQISELSIISAIGAGTGLVLAAAAMPVLLSLDPVAARAIGSVAIDWRVQVFTLSLALFTALATAIVPALLSLRRDAAAGTGSSAPRAIGSSGARRARRVLVAAQVALCVALLMVGAVLISGLRTAARVNPGFNSSNVLTAQLRLPTDPYNTPERRAAIVDTILARVRTLPGVVAASTTMNDFVPGNAYQTLFHIEGRPTPDGQPHTTQFRRVSTDYFRTMEIRQIRGRTFTAQDGTAAPHVAIVSRMFAEQLFSGEDAIGRTLRLTRANAPPITIVGIVEDVHDVSLTQAPEATLYLPWAQNSTNAVPVSVVIRTAIPPENLTSAVRNAVLMADPGMPLRRVQTLDTFLTDAVAPERFRALLLTIIAALGVTLAALGMYGVAYRAAADRVREFAIRLALGSRPSRILALVLHDTLWDVAVGAATGVILGAWLSTLTAPGIPNAAAEVIEAALLALSVIGFTTVAAVAIPALRVMRLHPASALRT